MNTFHFLTPQTPDLLSLTIEGERLRLVTISDQFEQDIFKDFTGLRDLRYEMYNLIQETRISGAVTLEISWIHFFCHPKPRRADFTSEITRYMVPSPAEDINEVRKFIVESRRSMQIGNNLQFVILSKRTEEFLGCCGLHGEGKVRMPELGIWLKKSAHGNGYGREAIHTLVNWAWNNIDLDYFIYPVDRKNIASSKIPESLGGEVVKALKVETPTGKVLDEVIYKISRTIASPNRLSHR